MLKVYELLPEFYRVKDVEEGEPLKKFLEPLQDKLDEIYADEHSLRDIQDPLRTREDFLIWIAKSLGWDYISETTEERRNEALEIANFHDLKGTPYAMRLLSNLCYGGHFDRLIEFYSGNESSISTIKETWAGADHHLKDLLAGGGEFATPEWLEAALAARGKAYAFDEKKRLYEYIAHIEVDPDAYVYGEIRDATIKFIRNYEKFHPGGRWCYLYISTPDLGMDRQLGIDLIEELVGGIFWDSEWTLDEGKLLDSPFDPVHPSVSYHFPQWHQPFDMGRLFDSEGDDLWTLDEGDCEANVLIELH